jgi:hypothetical protein
MMHILKNFTTAFLVIITASFLTGCTGDKDGKFQAAEQVDPCLVNPCAEANKSVCQSDEEGGYSCLCDDYYYDYGDGQCLPVDPCEGYVDCREEGRQCQNNDGVAVCGDCAAGFEELGLLCRTNVTFFAFGDSQYGGGAQDKNTYLVNGMNSMPGVVWPDDTPLAGTPVTAPLGVLIAGDLTQNGVDGREAFLAPEGDQIGQMHLDYGLTGTDGVLNFPVYEGYGNHDFEPDHPDDATEFHWRFYYTEDPTPAVDSVAERNPDRIGLLNVAEGDGGHYSWEWGRVHLINLNLFPGDYPSDEDENSLVRDPRGSLSFLRDDLETWVGDSGRPVIIMSHYGFSSFNREPRWWTDEQREEFRLAIEGYNLIAYIHGHSHGTFSGEWEGYNIYCVGSPYYENYNSDNKCHFTVFHITESRMLVHDAAASPEQNGEDPHFTGWSDEVAITSD